MRLHTVPCLLLLCVSASQALFLPLDKFRSTLKSSCYRVESDVVDGQREPAATSVDTLIYYVQQMETLGMNSTGIIHYLLSSYSIRDLDRAQTGEFFTHETFRTSEDIQRCFVTSVNTSNAALMSPMGDNDDAKCSMFFLLSNTLNKTETGFREQGVVALDPLSQPAHAVDISRTLLGIYTGLTYREVRLEDILKCIGVSRSLTASEVPNPIYFATVSELLGLVSYYTVRGKFYGYTGNGAWSSGSCPRNYEIPQQNSSFFTYSRFRGAVDGLILGNWARKNPKFRLSALLRSYYSGTDVPTLDNGVSLSYAFRREMIDSLQAEIQSQSRLYLDIYGLKTGNLVENSQDSINEVWNTVKGTHFDGLFTDFLGRDNNARRTTIHNTNDLVNDVIFILDNNNLDEQLEVVQAVAGNLTAGFSADKSEQSSSVSVYINVNERLDQLAEPLKRSSNTGAVGCSVANYLRKNDISNRKKKDEGEVMEWLNNTLNALKEREQSKITVPGRAVILFSFSKMKEDDRLDRAARAINHYHYDIPLYIVTSKLENIPNYVQTQATHVFTFNKAKVAGTILELQSYLANSSMVIQLPECRKEVFAQNAEAIMSHRGYISRKHVQRWMVPPHYFDRSDSVELTVNTTSKDDISVCLSRRLTWACESSDSGTEYYWKLKKPCNKRHHTLCDPIYLTITGMRKPALPCNATECLHEEQIEYSIKPKGLRCGAMSIASSIGLLVLSLFLIFHNSQNN